jgi:hypothetical protein
VYHHDNDINHNRPSEIGEDKTPQTTAKIYYYNLTLCINTSLCKNEVSFIFIALYADNSLPAISYILCVFSEGGHVGRNMYSTPDLWEK